MSKYSKANDGSKKTRDEAIKIARGTQKPGQTREQTKLITQGIQKGIEQFKKEQRKKDREESKKQKKSQKHTGGVDNIPDEQGNPSNREPSGPVLLWRLLPWVLLVVSWALFGGYVFLGIF